MSQNQIAYHLRAIESQPRDTVLGQLVTDKASLHLSRTELKVESRITCQCYPSFLIGKMRQKPARGASKVCKPLAKTCLSIKKLDADRHSASSSLELVSTVCMKLAKSDNKAGKDVGLAVKRWSCRLDPFWETRYILYYEKFWVQNGNELKGSFCIWIDSAFYCKHKKVISFTNTMDPQISHVNYGFWPI